jgi:putative membrane protein insertion efficiency factor
VKRALLAAVRFYQRAISPAFPPRCRFYPSCSAYALEAIERHGAARGTWLAVRRIAKCAPWHPGGVDLVPEPRGRRAGTGADRRSSSMPTPPASGAPTPPSHADLPALHGASPEESSVA